MRSTVTKGGRVWAWNDSGVPARAAADSPRVSSSDSPTAPSSATPARLQPSRVAATAWGRTGPKGICTVWRPETGPSSRILVPARRQAQPEAALVADQRGGGLAVEQDGRGQPVLGQAGQRQGHGGGGAGLQAQAQALGRGLQHEAAEAEAVGLAGGRLQQAGAELIEQLLGRELLRLADPGGSARPSSSRGTPGSQRPKVAPGLASALRNSMQRQQHHQRHARQRQQARPARAARARG